MGIKKSFIKEYIKNKIEVVVDTYRLQNTHQSYSSKWTQFNFEKKKIQDPGPGLPGILSPPSVSRLSIIFVNLKALTLQILGFCRGSIVLEVPGKVDPGPQFSWS